MWTLTGAHICTQHAPNPRNTHIRTSATCNHHGKSCTDTTTDTSCVKCWMLVYVVTDNIHHHVRVGVCCHCQHTPTLSKLMNQYIITYELINIDKLNTISTTHNCWITNSLPINPPSCSARCWLITRTRILQCILFGTKHSATTRILHFFFNRTWNTIQSPTPTAEASTWHVGQQPQRLTSALPLQI